MNTTDYLAEIRSNGYVIIPSLLHDNEIASIRQALAPWLNGQYMGRNDFEGYSSERVYGLLAKDPVLALIVEHPVILAIVDKLLEPDYHYKLFFLIICYLSKNFLISGSRR